MLTTIVACVILLSFILISERYFRSKGEAKHFRVNGKWQSHTILYFLLAMGGIILAPLFSFLEIGNINNYPFIGWFGIGILILGLLFRTIAMRTLGKYHTRSLIVVPNQPLVERGIYKYIRHPGYLGTIIGGLGFGLATVNWIIILYTAISVILLMEFRIKAEEKMMLKSFGAKYKTYMCKTKSLIPFIY